MVYKCHISPIQREELLIQTSRHCFHYVAGELIFLLIPAFFSHSSNLYIIFTKDKKWSVQHLKMDHKGECSTLRWLYWGERKAVASLVLKETVTTPEMWM